MNLPETFLDLLRCPETGQPLSPQEGQLQTFDAQTSGTKTSAAKAAYPLVGGIPWLIAHPRNSLLDWGAKLNHFQQTLLKEISELEVAIKTAEGAAHDRIECLLLAKKDFLMEITTLLEPITRTKVAALEHYNALLDRAPTTQNLLSYEANIYRDWQWGDEENELSLKLVLEFAPENLGKLCVLGAGACRLALDIHQQAKPELTVATDINPLFLLAVNKLLSNESFFLTEFPLHPKLTDYVAIKHQMKALENAPDNFHLCFADSAKPPFKKHGFDTVLTPWLIDIQPHEFKRFLRQLNQYIPVGGRWLNFGSLVFNQARESLCYSAEEVVELAAEAGFEIEELNQREIPYLKSPYNAGYRMENVWVWEAIKRNDVPAEKDIQLTPDWLLDINKPVPVLADMQSQYQQSAFLADILSQIDGRRSLSELASRLAKNYEGDEAEFEQLLTQYFLQARYS